VAVWRPVPDDPPAGARGRGSRPRRAAPPPRPSAAPIAEGAGAGEALLGRSRTALAPWQARLATMAACTAPGVLARMGGLHLPPPLAMLVYGGAVMAAAFLLGAAAEVAELDAPPGIAVAGVAFVAVLPEYTIEVYFAFSGHVEFVTASLTGSTRLLLSCAVGMPAIAAAILARRGQAPPRVVDLAPQRRLDLAVIAAASLYAPVIIVRGHLAWPDALVLLGLYALYMRRLGGGAPEAPHLVGIAAQLGALPRRDRLRWVGGLMSFSAVAVLITAEPFAQAVMATGTAAGVSPYLLVQWLVPLATETPELVVAFVLVQHARPGQAVAVLLSSAVSQWTFALGTLPLAYAAGAGHGPLPLLANERIELLLTAGQGLMAVAVLVTLRLRRSDAIVMLTMFALQLVLANVIVRTLLAVAYLAMAVDLLTSERAALRWLAHALRAAHEPADPSGR
jgi:cation:H+ antiporter